MSGERLRLIPYAIVIVISVLLSYGLMRITGAGAPGAGVSGQSTLDRVLATKTLRVGAVLGGPPYGFRDQAGNPVGIIPEIGAEMAKGLGVKLEIVDTAAPSRIPFLQAGKIDLSFGTITLDRAKSVSFAGVWVVDATAGAVLKSSGITDYNGLKGKSVALGRGTSADLYATKNLPDARLLRMDAASAELQAVLQKQADALMDDYSFVLLAAAEHPELQVLKAVTYEPSGVMVSLGDQKWINWIQYFLNDFYRSGVSTCGCGKDILRKYLKGEPLPLVYNY